MLCILLIFDMRENRLPNKLIGLLLLLCVLELELVYGGLYLVPSSHILGFVIGFSAGLILYTMKVMAAGDVKLISVLCLYVGIQDLVPFYATIFISGTVFVVFYGLSYIATSDQTVVQWMSGYVDTNVKSRLLRSYSRPIVVYRMPLAPAIVFGFLLYPLTF
ncbi:A24 family peptidase [Vibrio sp. SCSIO 43140]|uniref:A24 family peptidase n=1 Tax=Vibrio sp. SCSIO 43140 TaxID=2819100 RepID=UPI003365938B